MATVEWTKDAHAVPFELRPPADVASGGLVSGCVEIFVGPVLIGQAPVEMVVGEPSDGLDDASEKSSVLGPVTKVGLFAGCLLPRAEGGRKRCLLPCACPRRGWLPVSFVPLQV